MGINRYTDKNLDNLKSGLLMEYANILITRSPRKVPNTVIKMVIP
jgi:hypothetical protein